MKYSLKKEGKFSYIDVGQGTPIVVLHGLLGKLSNFDDVCDALSNSGYRVLLPELPLYTLPLLKTKVLNFAKYVKEFIEHIRVSEDDNVVLIGNSLGGHIALLVTKLYPEIVKGLVITGSSGLFENAMGNSYPKRGSYEYIKGKAQDVFYDPEVATKEIVDDVYETLNNRNKLIRTVAIAKSAIRHNMGKDLPNMPTPTCIIWGKNDTITPPQVAEEFDKLLPNSDLYWIDKCGHAAMMERPEEFNETLKTWLSEKSM